MATFTLTIANRISLGGAGRPTLWGNVGATTMTWGTDKWLSDSEDLIERIEKLLTNTLTLDSAARAQAINLVTNTLSLTSDITSILWTSGVWSYLFEGGVTNSEDRTSTTYTTPSSGSTTYTTPSPPATTWS